MRTLAALSVLLLVLMAPLAAAGRQPIGDPARGKVIYERCQGCHSLAYNRTGPRHCGLFGRRAGSVPGFAYSSAMAKSNVVWNELTLNRFLSSPTRMIPGTAMTYAGVPDPQERADLIAWLRIATVSRTECPHVEPHAR